MNPRMPSKRYAYILVATTLLSLSTFAYGKLFPFTLAEIVGRSDFIVVGNVRNIVVEEEKSAARPLPGLAVTISVNQLIKGRLPNEIEINTDPDFVEEATFRQHENVLLFLLRGKKGHGVAQGFMGKIPITSGIAGPVYLTNQPEKIPVEKLLAEIERILKEGSKRPLRPAQPGGRASTSLEQHLDPASGFPE